jgi:hypothetical protein
VVKGWNARSVSVDTGWKRKRTEVPRRDECVENIIRTTADWLNLEEQIS